MSTADIDGIKKDLAEISGFVRERIDPVTHEVDLLKEDSLVKTRFEEVPAL